jgi:hypothetical protein
LQNICFNKFILGLKTIKVLFLCNCFYFQSLKASDFNEDDFLRAYQLSSRLDKKSASENIAVYSKVIEQKFDVSSVQFKKSPLGAAYQNGKNYQQLVDYFKSCQEKNLEHVGKTTTRQVPSRGGGTRKVTETYTPNYDISAYQNRLLDAALTSQIKELNELGSDCVKNSSAPLRGSGNLEEITKTLDAVALSLAPEVSPEHTKGRTSFQKEFIDQNLKDSVYSFLHFQRQFGDQSKGEIEAGGDVSIEKTLETFCGGDSALSYKSEARSSSSGYGTSMYGGYTPPTYVTVPDKTTPRCDEKQKKYLAQLHAENIAKLDREKIKHIGAFEAQKMLNDGIKELNSKIEAWKNPVYDSSRRKFDTFSHRGQINDSAAARKKEATKKAYQEYQEVYLRLLSSPVGVLMRSESFKKDVGSIREEDVRQAKRYTHAHIHDIKTITNGIIFVQSKIKSQANSLYDSLNLLKYQKQELDIDSSPDNKKKFYEKRNEELKDLFQANPGALGRLLSKDPSYARYACEISVAIANDADNTAFWDKVWMGAGFVIGGALIVTGVGSGLGAATLAVTGASLAVTGAGIAHDQAQEHETNQDKSAAERALFAGSGDSQTAEDLAKLEEESISRLYGWRLSAVLAPLDLIGIGQVFKAAKHLPKHVVAQRFNKFAAKIDNDPALTAKAGDLRNARPDLFEDGKFGKLLFDTSQADEVTQAKFLEALKKWDGNPSTISETFNDFSPELTLYGGGVKRETSELPEVLSVVHALEKTNLLAKRFDEVIDDVISEFKAKNREKLASLIQELKMKIPEKRITNFLIAVKSGETNPDALKAILGLQLAPGVYLPQVHRFGAFVDNNGILNSVDDAFLLPENGLPRWREVCSNNFSMCGFDFNSQARVESHLTRLSQASNNLVAALYTRLGKEGRTVFDEEFLSKILKENSDLDPSSLFFYNFGSYGSDVLDATMGVYDARALKGASGHIPIEKQYPHLKLKGRTSGSGEIIEFRRFGKINPGSDKPPFRLMMKIMAQHLEHARLNDVMIYGRTDLANIELYKKFGFEVETVITQAGKEDEYIIAVKGSRFIELNGFENSMSENPLITRGFTANNPLSMDQYLINSELDNLVFPLRIPTVRMNQILDDFLR